jgi:hypothetical protein
VGFNLILVYPFLDIGQDDLLTMLLDKKTLLEPPAPDTLDPEIGILPPEFSNSLKILDTFDCCSQ